jgi:hypothetical protein
MKMFFQEYWNSRFSEGWTVMTETSVLLLTLVNPNFISVLHETVAHRNVLWMMDRFRAGAIVSN